MELIRGTHNLKPRHQGCAVTIGNFDGVHRGHRQLLVHLCQCAKRLGVPSCVLTFEPHSREFLQPQRAPARLTDLRGKVMALQRLGIDQLLVLPFNWQLASLEPDDFIDWILIGGLRAHHVVVGYDFAFGRGAKGGMADLRRMGSSAGFSVDEIPPVKTNGRAIGATLIREALAQGDLETAEGLLGRPYSLCGRVVHGDQRGRQLGFPTANLYLHHPRLPVAGVFAGQVDGAGLRGHPAAINIGRRPQFHGRDVRVEAFLLDFEGELYGARLEVTLRKRLRGEQAFSDVTTLVSRMGEDIHAVRAALMPKRT